MHDYKTMSENELFSEMDLITSELEARMEQDRKESKEAEEDMKLLYKAMGWKMPQPQEQSISELDLKKLYCIEHEVRINGKCIVTWWSPNDEHKILDVVDSANHKEQSIFCDVLTYEEFCIELGNLLK